MNVFHMLTGAKIQLFDVTTGLGLDLISLAELT